MRLKLSIATLIGLLISSAAIAQTNYKTVMVDTNGVLYKPTNFWTANSVQLQTISIGLGQTFSKSRVANFVDLLTVNTNCTTGVQSGWFSSYAGGAVASGFSGTRLIRYVLGAPLAGGGLHWGALSYRATFDMGVTMSRTNNIARFLLGDGIGTPAQTPSVAGIGCEVRGNSGTNQIRLVAHNGTTLTNGTWVNLGVASRYIVSILSRTNGAVQLYVAEGNSGSIPAINTNATISGGPTSDGSASDANLSCSLTIGGTNASTSVLDVYAAGAEIVTE